MKKRIYSLLLALAMALNFTVSAYAWDSNDQSFYQDKYLALTNLLTDVNGTFYLPVAYTNGENTGAAINSVTMLSEMAQGKDYYIRVGLNLVSLKIDIYCCLFNPDTVSLSQSGSYHYLNSSEKNMSFWSITIYLNDDGSIRTMQPGMSSSDYSLATNRWLYWSNNYAATGTTNSNQYWFAYSTRPDVFGTNPFFINDAQIMLSLPDNIPEPEPEEPVEEYAPIAVNYSFEDGSQAAEPYQKDHLVGYPFVINSPYIEGYTPDKARISDIALSGGATYAVTYAANPVDDDSSGTGGNGGSSGGSGGTEDDGSSSSGGSSSSLVSGLTNFYQAVKNIFVPREDYFHNRLSDLNKLAQSRFGGFAQLFFIFYDFFNELKNATSSGMVLSIPAGFFGSHAAIEVDFLNTSVVRVFVGFIYVLCNSLVCLGTAIVCYKKIHRFFTDS